MTAFKSSVFPIIFAIVLLSFVEKGLKKILPDSIRSRIAPFFSLLIVVPVTIVIFGPLGSMLSDTIANFYMSLYKFNPTIAGGFIGAIAQVLVIFGIHWGLFPIIFSNIEKFGFDTILAVFGPSIIAQSGAAFGVWLKTKDKRLKQIASPAAIMGFFGISEPAIYGITLKYRKAFACAVIGGGIGGADCWVLRCSCYGCRCCCSSNLPCLLWNGIYWIYHCLLWSILNFSCLNLFCRI